MADSYVQPVYEGGAVKRNGKFYIDEITDFQYDPETTAQYPIYSSREVDPSKVKLIGYRTPDEQVYVSSGTEAAGQTETKAGTFVSLDKVGTLRTDERGNTFAMMPTGQTGIINKATGKPLVSEYGERATGNMWSGTYTGSGNTGYGVQFDKNGSPIFYTQGASSSDIGDIQMVLSIASIIPSPIQPFAMAANAAIAASQGDILGAIASAAGLAGASEVASAARIAKAAESGDLAGVISGVAGLSGMDSIPGLGVDSKQVLAGINAAKAIESGDFVKGIIGAAGAAGVTNIGGMDLADISKTVNMVEALGTGDPLKIAKAATKLKLPTDQSPYASEDEIAARTEEILKDWSTNVESGTASNTIEDLMTASGVHPDDIATAVDAVATKTDLDADTAATLTPEELAKADTLTGVVGNDTLLGGEGNDTADGYFGVDDLTGDISAEPERRDIYVAEPEDTINKLFDPETGQYVDFDLASLLADTTQGALGVDDLLGDTLLGGESTDTGEGYFGVDDLLGDTLTGVEGNDTVDGYFGVDDLEPPKDTGQFGVDDLDETKETGVTCEVGFHDNGYGLCVPDEDKDQKIEDCQEGYVYDLALGMCVPITQDTAPGGSGGGGGGGGGGGITKPAVEKPKTDEIQKATDDTQAIIDALGAQASQQTTTVNPVYQQDGGEYLKVGSPFDYDFFSTAAQKQAAQKQRQPVKIASGGYLNDLPDQDMSVDDLLNLLR